MDELSSLPYLDCVIRETLRVHSPVPSTVRVAVKDDVIPLERPFVDRGGMEQYNLRYVCIFVSFSILPFAKFSTNDNHYWIEYLKANWYSYQFLR